MHPDAGGSDTQAVLVNQAYAHLLALTGMPDRAGSCGAGSPDAPAHSDSGASEGRSRPSSEAADASRSSPGSDAKSASGMADTDPAAGFRPAPDPAWSLLDVGALPSGPAELLLRIVEAAHEIGEVVSVDPQTGLLEVVVGVGTAGYGAGALGAGQLLVQVGGDLLAGDGVSAGPGTQTAQAGDTLSATARPSAQAGSGHGWGDAAHAASNPEDDGIPVAFTLEPLGTQPAPSIHEVVADLMRRVRSLSQSV